MECHNENQIMIKTVDKKEIIITGNYSNIRELMTKLEKEHSYRRDCQQLIFTGKILKENDTIPEMNAQGFLVLLMKKTKMLEERKKDESIVDDVIQDKIVVKDQKTEVSVVDESKIEENMIINPNIEVNGVEDVKQEKKATEEQKTEVSVDEETNSEVPLNNIEPNQEMLENLMTMGFDVNDIKIILKATNNNMEMTGAILMEPSMLEEIKIKIANGENPLANPISGSAVENSVELTEQQVMEMMEQNPQVFQQLLGKIVEQKPEIANLVQSDPQTFISLLTKIINQTGMFTNRGIEQGETDISQPSQQQQQIEMTQEEKKVIESLQPMFPHLPTVTILETLRACGNNEEMTANLLFEY